MNPDIGWFYTFCCCEDAQIVKDISELQELLGDTEMGFSFFETAEELCETNCSCDGPCRNLERLKLKKNQQPN